VTHCECGKIIAQNWHLPTELVEAIACHHCPREAVGNPELTSIVSVSDLLCRLGGLGYGYTERNKPISPRNRGSRFWRHTIARFGPLIRRASHLKPRDCLKKCAQ
jgi:HD-like signal output (HDOD) protein